MSDITDTQRLDALQQLLRRTGTRVTFDVTCGGSRVIENAFPAATIYIQDDDHGFEHGLRDALDGLVQRHAPTLLGLPVAAEARRRVVSVMPDGLIVVADDATEEEINRAFTRLAQFMTGDVEGLHKSRARPASEGRDAETPFTREQLDAVAVLIEDERGNLAYSTARRLLATARAGLELPFEGDWPNLRQAIDKARRNAAPAAPSSEADPNA